jgi:hypothetical protein
MENINETLVLARAKNVDFILITQKEYRTIEEELLSSIKGGEIALAYKYPKKEPLSRYGILLYKALY